MPLFPVLDIEAIVQEGDKTRLDATKSYCSGDIKTITKIEIQPDSAEAFYDVTEEGYLDWQYDFDPTIVPPATVIPDTNSHAVVVKITGLVDPEDPMTSTFKLLTKNLTIISEGADMLFSTDDMLRKHEGDILKYVADGRATFKDVHRRAQTLILAWLDKESFIDDLGNKLTIKSLADLTELREWSGMMVLRLIFESVRSANDDVFSEKAEKYRGLEDFYRDRAIIHINVPGADTTNATFVAEPLDIRSCRVFRA